MYLSRNASRTRLREAQNARNNRAEIVRALSHGQITRRDLFKWGIFTSTGALALKNGLSPYAGSAYAQDIPTGAPPTPLFGAQPFTQEMPRLLEQKPYSLTKAQMVGIGSVAVWPDEAGPNEKSRPSKRLSWHTDFTESGGAAFKNPTTGDGPLEGRPPGEWFAHQRWDGPNSYFPEIGFLLSLGRLGDGLGFHSAMPDQHPDSVWSFAGGGLGARGTLPPPLIKARYGEPMITRIYNNTPVDRAQNNGFGRNEISTHFHNAHNASASDGASNAFHFPGTFYDYHWGTTLARADMINTQATDRRASGPDGNGGLNLIPGDFREIQGTMWAHDHRFFFTAENVYKGNAMMINYYSGPDRGNEDPARRGHPRNDGVNLRLPSGFILDWGNVDFDVNLLISDMATDQDGQYFFDIFNTDGFLGDQVLVNFAYKPFFNVIPRKYRFRILNACMSRFWQFCLVDEAGRRVPFKFVANDGNLVPNPIKGNLLDRQGTGERYDIVVDFKKYAPGDKIWLVNVLEMKDGRRPEGRIGHRRALNRGSAADPAVGAVLEFRIAAEVESVDAQSIGEQHTHRAGDRDRSRAGLRLQLTEQIPIVEPVRTRHVEWKRGGGDSFSALPGGGCIPECELRGPLAEAFPWSVRVNGESTHSLNANRVSNLIPRPGETEHWTYENGGGGWDHPIHLHFEEGITMNRGDDEIPDTEFLVRKDVWRLREGGTVTFQVTFGEYGGAYVNHCHNTVHEDFAMLMRYDVLTDDGSIHDGVIPTPMPTEYGCEYNMSPELLPEGDPANAEFFFQAALEAATKG